MGRLEEQLGVAEDEQGWAAVGLLVCRHLDRLVAGSWHWMLMSF